MEGAHEHVDKLLFKKRRLDSSSQVSPSLGILFKQFLSFWCQAFKLGLICIIIIVFKECISQILLGSDGCVLQLHIPLQRSPAEVILEEVNDQLLIIRVHGHFSVVRPDVGSGITDPLVFFKVKDFELNMYLDVWY